MKKFSQINEDFDFRQVEASKKDKLYLLLNFAGGDADTEHPEYHEFKGIKFSEYKKHLTEINKAIDDYKKLKGALDVNSGDDFCDNDYKKVEAKFGKDIASLYDYAPNDPQCDFQYKCYLSSMELIGYDSEGNKHQSYIR